MYMEYPDRQNKDGQIRLLRVQYVLGTSTGSLPLKVGGSVAVVLLDCSLLASLSSGLNIPTKVECTDVHVQTA